MKLYKIYQGSTFDNLKNFIYLTNEYGIPSSRFVDDFIDQFSTSIAEGTFIITKNQFNELEELWKEIKDNSNKNEGSLGSLFYFILSGRLPDIIKEKHSNYNWDNMNISMKRNLVSKIIKDFGGFVNKDTVQKEKDNFNNFMNSLAENNIDNSKKVQEKQVKEKQSKATKKVLQGFDMLSVLSVCNNSLNTEEHKEQAESIEGQEHTDKENINETEKTNSLYNETEEEECMTKLYFENTPELIRIDENSEEYIEIYIDSREKIANARLYKDRVVLLKSSYIFDIKEGAYNYHNEWKRLEKLHSSYVINNELIQSLEFKSPSEASNLYYGTYTNGWIHWKNKYNQLIDIYRQSKKVIYEVNKANEFRIGKILNYEGVELGKIISITEIEINGKTYNISDYIYEHNLDTNKIMFGKKIRFNTIYSEVK